MINCIHNGLSTYGETKEKTLFQHAIATTTFLLLPWKQKPKNKQSKTYGRVPTLVADEVRRMRKRRGLLRRRGGELWRRWLGLGVIKIKLLCTHNSTAAQKVHLSSFIWDIPLNSDQFNFSRLHLSSTCEQLKFED